MISGQMAAIDILIKLLFQGLPPADDDPKDLSVFSCFLNHTSSVFENIEMFRYLNCVK